MTESKLSTASSSTDPSSTASGIPTNLPKVITPDGGVPKQPENTTLVQVGFNYSLNYPFVVASSVSVAQIFQYLPLGISDGLSIPIEQVTMHTLQPYDTTKELNYITTLALVFIPSDFVDTLKLDLQTPASKMYNNVNPSVTSLMLMVNPSFPILAYQPLAGSGNRPNGRGTAEDAEPGENGSPLGGNNSGGSPVSPTTIGILVGGITGAAAYGAAMFIIARRYRQRRERHQRASSTATTSEYDDDHGHHHHHHHHSRRHNHHQSAASGPLMGGGLRADDRYSPPYGGRLTPGDGRNSRGSGRSGGTSARTQQISAPMMAENSLGWN